MAFAMVTARQALRRLSAAPPSAIGFSAHGDPDRVLGAVASEPTAPGKGEARVRMLAAPVHPMDIGVIRGTYPLTPVLPAIAGSEGVGIIEETQGDCNGLEVGDVVVPSGAQFHGTWRKFATVGSGALIRIGSDGKVAGKDVAADEDLAASLSLSAINPVTAKLLVGNANLSSGDTIIQNAGNGSVGLFVSQVAAKKGIKTVSIIRDGPLMEDSSERATRIGGSHLVVPDSLARTPRMDDLLSDLGRVALGLDGTGDETSLRAMARALSRNGAAGGELVVYGAAAGGRSGVRVPASSLIFGGVSMRGFWLASWARANRGEYERLVRESAEEIARGELRVNVDRRALSAFWVDAWAGVKDPLRTRKQVIMLTK